jgi:hypothetical protein
MVPTSGEAGIRAAAATATAKAIFIMGSVPLLFWSAVKNPISDGFELGG